MDAWPESLIATHSGLRGRPGVDLTEDVVGLAVRRLAGLLERDGLPRSLGVARDGRPGSDALAAAVVEVAFGCGLDAIDFGAVSTPAAKLATRLRGLGGVVIVTGSHLKPDWNGLKLVAAPGYLPVDVRDLPAAAKGRLRHGRGRVASDSGAVEDHVAAVCASVDAGSIRGAGLAVGCSGGVGTAAAIALERLGCRPPGDSPDAVLVLDADADRLALVDERGERLDSEVVLPLVALARDARVVVKGADTSRLVDELVGRRRGVVHVVSPGELHLVEALLRTGGDLAGEGNGGVVVPAVGASRDGLAAAAAVLALMARARTPLSELAARLPRYAVRRSTLPCDTREEAQAVLALLAARIGAAPPLDPEDGLLVERGSGSWGLVRRSATEPVLRVTTEARTAEAAEELHAELSAHLLAEVGA